MSSLPRLSAGRTLDDKFEIMGVLGEGGMSTVYDALRTAEGDRVALKVIHRHLAGDAQIRGRFAREAAILHRLEGEHVCPILAFGEGPDPRRPDAGLLYIVLPRIDGPALDDLLKEGELPIARAVDVVLDICAGLGEAHARGIIHRDLKPGNVLLRNGETAVVVDFGMAKIVSGGGTGTTALTQHNMVFGTPEYMAPEQARGDELDARCDVYAAGVILYELLTGTVPFAGTTALSVLTAHLTSPPEPPRERAPQRAITPALEAVVLHAIAKDPAARYATAGGFASAIRSAILSPEDAAGVRPSARATVAVDTTDGDAATMPLPVSHDPSSAWKPMQTALISPEASEPFSRVGVAICVLAALIGVALGAWLSMNTGP
ncbi:MAG: serine/threonine protein kinase [Myxococcota bacterium]|nr:serine/threonine protein kinase [Myxococcota bacterium]